MLDPKVTNEQIISAGRSLFGRGRWSATQKRAATEAAIEAEKDRLAYADQRPIDYFNPRILDN